MMLNCTTKILTAKRQTRLSIEQIYIYRLYRDLYTQNTPSVQRFSEHGIYISTPLFHIFLLFFYATTSYHQPRMHNMLLLLFYFILFFFCSFFLFFCISSYCNSMNGNKTKCGWKKFLHFLMLNFKSPHTHTHTH